MKKLALGIITVIAVSTTAQATDMVAIHSQEFSNRLGGIGIEISQNGVPSAAQPTTVAQGRPSTTLKLKVASASKGSAARKSNPKACMTIVYSGPKTENAELSSNEAFNFHVPRSKRNKITADLVKCLDASFDQHRSGTAAGRATYGYRQWYTKVSGGFDYCSTYNPIVSGEGILIHCDHVGSLPNGMFPGSN